MCLRLRTSCPQCRKNNVSFTACLFGSERISHIQTICLRAREVIKTEFRQDYCHTCLALMAPNERRMLVPQFENLDEYRARKVQFTTQRMGSMHPGPGFGASDDLGVDFDFDFDLDNDSATLKGQEQGRSGGESADDPFVIVDHDSRHGKEKESTRDKKLDDIFLTTDGATFDAVKWANEQEKDVGSSRIRGSR